MERIVATAGETLIATKNLNLHTISLTCKTNSNVLFIGKASVNASELILNIL